MGMIFLSAEESKKNVFEGHKWMFLNTLKEKAWQDFLREFNQRVEGEAKLDDFKEELWNTVMKFGEFLLKELLEKMISLRESKLEIKDDAYKDSSTPDKRN